MTAVFSHRDRGRSPDQWGPLIDALPDVDSLDRFGQVVVVAAHPDDETLGAGGLLATAAAIGLRISVLIASDGEASHPASPTHTPQALAVLRRAEVRAAVSILAPGAELRHLSLPDGHLESHVAELAYRIGAACTGGDLIVSPWWGDGHPDHAACARAAAIAAQRTGTTLWQYPIWAWHWGARLEDLVDSLRVLPLDEIARRAKRAALSCHVSQHQPLSNAAGDEAILPPEVVAHFERPVEVFVTESAAAPEYFNRLYRADPDPWGLADRFYEQRKRNLLLAALPRPRFERAFEPGCATGLLTTALAARCDEVVAWDLAEAAVAQACVRTASARGVTVHLGAIPEQWPDGPFDLVVLSEVGYYCLDLAALVRRVDATLTADGVLVACHWRHPAALHPHTAEAVHAALGQDRHRLVLHDEADFLLEVWTADRRSVAQLERLVQ